LAAPRAEPWHSLGNGSIRHIILFIETIRRD
jgi:hypothetical protein